MPDGLTIMPGATFYPNLEWTVSGLVGTLGVRITKDSDGTTVLARATAGITEFGTSGEYTATLVAPTTAGEYTIRWDDGATTVGHVASEGLTVTYSTAGVSVPSGIDLCTVADVKLAMETTSAAADPLVQTLITAASAMIPNKYQRDFAPVTAASYTFKVIGFSVDLAPHDLRAATTVTLDPSGSAVVLAATQYRLSPSGAESNLGTYTNVQLSRLQNLYSTSILNFGYTELGILGNWGPAAILPDVTRAAALTVASWLSARTNSQTSDLLGDLAHSSREVRPERFGGFAIPFDAHMILSQYERPAASFA